jgi:ubiquinone/menaquinone biosynthesis C-methylase UbiE
MSQPSLDLFYESNLRLTQANGYLGYNAGYAEVRGRASFDQHQKDLVWRLLGDNPIGPESTVLDVGCGIGGPSGWIMERYKPARVLGLEYCWSSARTAEKRWENAPVRPIILRSDAHALPVADASVDVIFNLESALHYRNKHQFLAECFRVLRPGGRLCLGDITTRYRRLFRILGFLDHFNTQYSTHARLWSSAEYLEAFNSLGFQMIHHQEVGRQASYSLRDGLEEVDAKGWKAARGFRGRFFYLLMVEMLLRRRWLEYDLFALARP